MMRKSERSCSEEVSKRMRKSPVDIALGINSPESEPSSGSSSDSESDIHCEQTALPLFLVKQRLLQEREYVISENVFGVLQPEITPKMRSVLVDWMVDVCEDNKMAASTLFLSVQILDQVLRVYPIKRTQFQLMGCACLFIAAKYDETEPLSCLELVNIADNCFGRHDLVNMERSILLRMDFRMAIPTRHYFLTALLDTEPLNRKECSFAHYLLELTLLEHSFNRYPASRVAGAVYHLTRQVLRPRCERLWKDSMAAICNIAEQELVEVVVQLREWHSLLHLPIVPVNPSIKVLSTNPFKSIDTKYTGNGVGIKSVAFVTMVPRSLLRFDHYKGEVLLCPVSVTQMAPASREPGRDRGVSSSPVCLSAVAAPGSATCTAVALADDMYCNMCESFRI